LIQRQGGCDFNRNTLVEIGDKQSSSFSTRDMEESEEEKDSNKTELK